MSRRMKTWFTKLADFPVQWVCAPTSSGFVRVVTMTTVLDGRDIETHMTPREALELARRLTQQATRLNEINAQMGNGYEPEDES